jgi:hypothetical protein
MHIDKRCSIMKAFSHGKDMTHASQAGQLVKTLHLLKTRIFTMHIYPRVLLCLNLEII